MRPKHVASLEMKELLAWIESLKHLKIFICGNKKENDIPEIETIHLYS